MDVAEEWKPIKNCSYYLISNRWRVKSLDKTISFNNHGTMCSYVKKGRVLKPSLLKQGYLVVSIFYDGSPDKKLCKIHRLVAEAFIPNPENKPQVDHIDTNPSNNVVTNLRWVTSLENQNNPTTLNRLRESLTQYNKSEAHKLTVQRTQGHSVLQFDKRTGAFIAEYPSINEAAIALNTTACCIKRVCDGIRKYHRSWIFKYKENGTETV
jgi:hypothetical protein